MKNSQRKLLKTALILSVITIVYNLIEGIVSIYFGTSDETLALLGFGVDSFVEVISGLGVGHMVWRMQSSDDVDSRDAFERRALRITGTAFYILTAGLLLGAVFNFISKTAPETTIAGAVIAFISILTMYFLMRAKLKVGGSLKSDAIIADANCTKTCFYLSIILLTSSILFEVFSLYYIDILGSLGIAWFAFSEGKEAFEKASSSSLSCCCCHDD